MEMPYFHPFHIENSPGLGRPVPFNLSQSSKYDLRPWFDNALLMMEPNILGKRPRRISSTMESKLLSDEDLCSPRSSFTTKSEHLSDEDRCSRRSSFTLKSEQLSDEDLEDADDADEELSVGSVTPPPSASSSSDSSITSAMITDEISNRKISMDGHPQGLKFSIDNILRPGFCIGKPIEVETSKKCSSTDESPVDLSKEYNNVKDPKTENRDTSSTSENNNIAWPAWVYCTRYSDRPSSGPRMRVKRKERSPEEKRPRTAFTGDQLSRLKKEFTDNHYLTERRRQELANELGLHEAQIKIWFQNKRAKIKKASGTKNPLALKLMAEGLYNHSTLPLHKDDSS